MTKCPASRSGGSASQGEVTDTAPSSQSCFASGPVATVPWHLKPCLLDTRADSDIGPPSTRGLRRMDLNSGVYNRANLRSWAGEAQPVPEPFIALQQPTE